MLDVITNDEASYYATFSSLQKLPPSLIQIFSSLPYSQAPNLCSTLRVLDKVSQLNISTGKIIVFRRLDSRQKDKDSDLNDNEGSSNLVCS
jgi:hypothetical protein